MDAAEERARESSKWAKEAEVAAGAASAQAMAALKIAEHARAEAEAARRAAEEAVQQALDRRRLNLQEVHRGHAAGGARGEMHVEQEKDDLRARLAETEQALAEKTRRVSELEGSLEDMTRYLRNLKAMMAPAAEDMSPMPAQTEAAEGGKEAAAPGRQNAAGLGLEARIEDLDVVEGGGERRSKAARSASH
eukprot:SM000081S22644  [mRNA]  locus=s81:374110:375173:+ [translate_table: standard]